jgi:hypothetical protein
MNFIFFLKSFGCSIFDFHFREKYDGVSKMRNCSESERVTVSVIACSKRNPLFMKVGVVFGIPNYAADLRIRMCFRHGTASK